ncbi:PAS domain-containing protein [Methanolobus sp. ZRKC3]|uniref:PAS domain S-box protein n=1 Tax=Methanolobus sp. ZRKC3 TaxID=3125786 RepID=UPI003253AF6B
MSYLKLFLIIRMMGITINEPGGLFLEVNQTICNALGYAHEEMLQMTPYEIISAKAAAQFPEKIKELQQKGYVLFESIVVSKDRKHYPVELNMRIINYQGKPPSFPSSSISQNARN